MAAANIGHHLSCFLSFDQCSCTNCTHLDRPLRTQLRTQCKLELCMLPIYKTNEVAFRIHFLNARSLHKHMNDICSDLNYNKTNVNIFSETSFCNLDNNKAYAINAYELFRNDAVASCNVRPYGVQLFIVVLITILDILIV